MNKAKKERMVVIMGDIKKISAENIKCIIMSIQDYKNYRLLLDATNHMFEGRDYSFYGDIVSEIKNHIEEMLYDICNHLSEMYNDWSGKSNYKKSNYANIDDYYNIIDAIDEQNEDISGQCTHIVGVPDYIVNALYIPKNFMKEFIDSYGLFIIDGEVVYIQ